MQLHRRIGGCLEAGYGAQAGDIAAQLVVHFERGGAVERAVDYRSQAADHAIPDATGLRRTISIY